MYGYLGPAQGVGIKLPEFIYNAGLLFPLGFRSPSFQSMDYFPLLPWFFVPAFFYKTHCKPLALAGRYTLWIYVLHQPVAMVFFLLIFGKI